MNNSTTENSLPTKHLRVIAWCISYGIVAVLITIGNSLTIAIFSNKKFPRKFGGYFLMNLAVADLMVGSSAMPMYIYIVYTLSYSSIDRSLLLFQEAYVVVDVFTGLASVFTLACIALERLYAVLYPMTYRWKKTKTGYYKAITMVWVTSGIASVVYILSSRNLLFILPRATFIYYLTILSVLSVFVISAAYVTVSVRVHLWNKAKMDMCVSKQEKRLATALYIVTVVFVLSWTPFHAMNIIANFTSTALERIPVDLVFSAKLLHYGNSLANPAIYSLKIPEFRVVVRRMFCKNWVRETRVWLIVLIW